MNLTALYKMPCQQGLVLLECFLQGDILKGKGTRKIKPHPLQFCGRQRFRGGQFHLCDLHKPVEILEF
jgi:hypothetical protein